MARLQILELPEGTGDDRPPFALVVDQYEPPPYPADVAGPAPFTEVAKKIGARVVLAFEETIEIPANEPQPSAGRDDDAEHAGTTQIVSAHERTRLDLCDALLLSRDTTWRQLVEQVAERQRTVTRLVRQLDAAEIKPDLDGA